jgi:hypothetical protein
MRAGAGGGVLCLVVAAVACGLARAASQTPALYVSVNGSDAADCSSARPCATFDRAYHRAQAGQTVLVAAGDYPAQQISADSTKTGSPVAFRPATASAKVRIVSTLPGVWGAVGLLIHGSHVAFHRIDILNGWGTDGASDVLVANVKAATFTVMASTNVSIVGGSVGPYQNDAAKIGRESRAVLVDHVFFHDYLQTDPAKHMECLHVFPVSNLVIRNSRFYNCAIMDLFFSNYGPGDIHDVVIENNWFDAPGSHGSGPASAPLMFEPFNVPISNVTIRFNSLLGSIGFGNSGPYSDVRMIANVASRIQYACTYGGSGFTYAYNVWTAAHCGPTDRSAPLQFVSSNGFDLHLPAAAAAVRAGDPSSQPARDIDGRLRPLHVPPDAGASQDETAELLIGRSIGAVALGMTPSDVANAYGPSKRVPSGAGTRTTRYAIEGRNVKLQFRANAVVAIETSSPYYTTAAGLGVGSTAAAARAASFAWGSACRKAYRRARGNSTTYLIPRNGSRSATIAAVVISRRGQDVCPRPPASG